MNIANQQSYQQEKEYLAGNANFKFKDGDALTVTEYLVKKDVDTNKLYYPYTVSTPQGRPVDLHGSVIFHVDDGVNVRIVLDDHGDGTWSARLIGPWPDDSVAAMTRMTPQGEYLVGAAALNPYDFPGVTEGTVLIARIRQLTDAERGTYKTDPFHLDLFIAEVDRDTGVHGIVRAVGHVNQNGGG